MQLAPLRRQDAASGPNLRGSELEDAHRYSKSAPARPGAIADALSNFWYVAGCGSAPRCGCEETDRRRPGRAAVAAVPICPPPRKGRRHAGVGFENSVTQNSVTGDMTC